MKLARSQSSSWDCSFRTKSNPALKTPGYCRSGLRLKLTCQLESCKITEASTTHGYPLVPIQPCNLAD